ncbi:MAG TPA: hypothetical protein VFQ15_09195 [Jiangellaceae bacterium]|nr:hypothetical protein [Jiangellaceae bacterium]
MIVGSGEKVGQRPHVGAAPPVEHVTDEVEQAFTGAGTQGCGPLPQR